jgi:hypothetical protein
MAAEWFYTTSKQQMGPVSWKELLELAEGGILKPHDMVWTEGMSEWVKAIQQKGLFAEDEFEEAVATKKSSYAQPKPPPGRRTRRKDDDDEEDERESKRDARKRKAEKAKMAVGVKVGLILGGIVFVLLFLGCAGGGLLWLTFSRENPRPIVNNVPNQGGRAIQDFTIPNIFANNFAERRVNLRQGQRVTITATSNVSHPHTDVDLFIIRASNNGHIASDQSIGPNSRVEFVVPATDSYIIRVENLGEGIAVTTRVIVEER